MAELSAQTYTQLLPVLPLKNMVALPKGVLPVKVARPISVKAVDQALELHGKKIFVTCQKSSKVAMPTLADLESTGVIAKILQVNNERDGGLRILLEGSTRAKVCQVVTDSPFITAEVEALTTVPVKTAAKEKALMRNLIDGFKEFVDLDDRLSQDILHVVQEVTTLDVLTDSIAIHLNLPRQQRQIILEILDLEKRALRVAAAIQSEIEILRAEKDVRRRVQNQMEKHQRDYYLNEQVRAIYHELGRDDIMQEVAKMREVGKKAKLSAEAMEKLQTECRRLEQMQPTSPEATVSRNYIEWLLSVPWHKKSRDRVSLPNAESILESSHAGMKKAKERVLEFVAAKKFAGENLKATPILCLVGAPGVGKTSLAKSISKALGRQLVQISLGGLRDEAEIRGHRRTYIGSMPGKIVSAMRKAKVVNPVILLDEIDKMSMDFRGDPSSALLEVLDPEQNKNFIDHFLEVEYDISNAIFIATANVYDNIPYPLLDRMETISLSGYTEAEKLNIAQKFLIPDLLKKHSIKAGTVKFSETVLTKVISEYTREAGVRQLNRLLAKLIRKSIQLLLAGNVKKVEVSEKDVTGWLGYPKHKQTLTKQKETVGVATGLAWTEVGGDILEVEIVNLKGKGGLTITGQLGEVMQESAQACLSYIRSQAESMGLKEEFYSDADLHIHMPEGAIPKDGPSAGVTITTALVSVLTGIPVDRSVAMSGEITLQGRVLAVGGLKEKILAAIRFGCKKVLVPEENRAEVSEFANELDGNIEICYTDNLQQVLNLALTKSPFKTKAIAKKVAKPKAKKSTTAKRKKSPATA